MMKRKFSFLAPLRIPSRAETRALETHLDNHVQDVPSPLTPPLSAFINRRELDHRTEAQLRIACTAVVKGEVIQDSVLTVYRPLHAKSVPDLPKHRANKISRPQTSRPVDSQAPPVPAIEQVKRNVPNAKSVQDFRVPTGLPRSSTSIALGQQPKGEHGSRSRQATNELRKSAAFSPTTLHRSRTAPNDESDGSYATPRTGSTDRNHNSVSTGFTSTAITPSLPLQHVADRALVDVASQKCIPKPTSKKEEAKSEQRRERELKRTSKLDLAQRSESRSRFRDWAFRPSPKNDVRPNTAIEAPRLHRSSSMERLRNKFSRPPSSHGQAPSTQHDRSSGVNLSMVNTRNSGIASTEGTHFEDERPSSELDLNRPLPRLPGLDTWDKLHGTQTAHSEPAPTISTMPKVHVVELMKASGLRPASTSAPMHIHQLHKEMAISPLRDDVKDITVSNTGRRISNTHSRSTSTADSCFSPTIRSRSGSAAHNHPAPDRVRSPVMSHHARISDAPTSYSHGSQPSLSYRGAVSSISEASIPNFSRKISIDSHGGIRSAEVTALPPMPLSAKSSGLRRMISSIQLVQVQIGLRKKNENKHWMDHMEKKGIKTGVLVARGNGAAAAPIVRY